LKIYGEIPGGKNIIKDLLYPFHTYYPIKFWSRYRWWRNGQLSVLLPHLNEKRQWVTVVDRLGAPGDALITANVIRCIKDEFPSIKVNCITPHPELIQYDPAIDSINKSESFYSFDSTYWEMIVRKERNENIIAHNMARLKIKNYVYKSKFYLTQEEKDWANRKLQNYKKPILAISTKSKELVKNWIHENWVELINSLKEKYSIIQLGDKNESVFKYVDRFAGELTMRESAAILSKVNMFIGPDSLLMHIANGLEITSIIIFGGSRPVECFGYKENINLESNPQCSPCWIHDGFEKCEYDVKCQSQITVSRVIDSINEMCK